MSEYRVKIFLDTNDPPSEAYPRYRLVQKYQFQQMQGKEWRDIIPNNEGSFKMSPTDTFTLLVVDKDEVYDREKPPPATAVWTHSVQNADKSWRNIETVKPELAFHKTDRPPFWTAQPPFLLSEIESGSDTYTTRELTVTVGDGTGELNWVMDPQMDIKP